MQDSQAPVLTVSILLKIDTLMHLYHALTQSLNFVKNTNLILDSDYKLVSLLQGGEYQKRFRQSVSA